MFIGLLSSSSLSVAKTSDIAPTKQVCVSFCLFLREMQRSCSSVAAGLLSPPVKKNKPISYVPLENALGFRKHSKNESKDQRLYNDDPSIASIRPKFPYLSLLNGIWFLSPPKHNYCWIVTVKVVKGIGRNTRAVAVPGKRHGLNSFSKNTH